MLTKITEGEDEEQVLVGLRCVEFAQPPSIIPPDSPLIPTPPDIIWGGSTFPADPEQSCSVVGVITYRDSAGRCWRVLTYSCEAPLGSPSHRSPIDCADLET